MNVLVVQNYEGTELGQVGAALGERGATVDLRLAHLGDPLPADASAHQALVVLGGGQNAMADDEYPYFPALLDLIRDFDRRDRSVLGICLGSQLVARAFGGRNRIGKATEFGWCAVTRSAEAAADPMLGAVSDTFPIFQWHDDTFELPPGAVRLASSASVANQAFRIGRAVYGTQFHFEADRPMVAAWSTAFSETIAARWPDWFGRHEAEAARNGPAADAAGLAIARAWAATIGQPALTVAK